MSDYKKTESLSSLGSDEDSIDYDAYEQSEEEPEYPTQYRYLLKFEEIRKW